MKHAKFAKQNTSHSALRMFVSILLITGSSIIWNRLPDEVVEAVTMKQLFDVYIYIYSMEQVTYRLLLLCTYRNNNNKQIKFNLNVIKPIVNRHVIGHRMS